MKNVNDYVPELTKDKTVLESLFYCKLIFTHTYGICLALLPPFICWIIITDVKSLHGEVSFLGRMFWGVGTCLMVLVHLFMTKFGSKTLTASLSKNDWVFTAKLCAYVCMCVCVFVSVYSCAFEKQQSELVKDFKLKVLTTSFLITSHLWIYKYTGFLLVWEDFGRMFDNSFPTCTFFVVVFLVEISLRILMPLFRPGSVHNRQWLSELKWLWPSVPWQVACELVSW